MKKKFYISDFYSYFGHLGEGDHRVVLLELGLRLREVIIVTPVIFYMPVLRAIHVPAFTLETHQAYLLRTLPTSILLLLYRSLIYWRG